MSWKIRGPHKYYYRSQGSAKLFFGRGAAAIEAAAHDEARRESRDQSRREHELTRREFMHVDAVVRRFMEWAAELAEAELIAAGYHRHDRGSWRIRSRKRIAEDCR